METALVVFAFIYHWFIYLFGGKFRFPLESVSPKLQSLFAQINVFYAF